MPYSLDIQGKRFVAELTGGGTLNNTRYEHDLSDAEYQSLLNWRTTSGRSWEKRFGYARMNNGSAWGYITPNATGRDLQLYRGYDQWGGTEQDRTPYYAIDTTTNDWHGLHEIDGTDATQITDGDSVVAISAGGSSPEYITHFAQVGDTLFVSLPLLGPIEMLAGTVHAKYTGTATVTAGSSTVTAISSALSTAQQQQMVGSFLRCTSDSAATEAIYRIVSVDSSTQVTLDRNYNGSHNSTGGNITIMSFADHLVGTSTPFSDTVSGDSSGDVVGSAWGRLLIGNTREANSLYSRGRLRWSGLDDSDEGTAPFTGIYGFHDDGYIDLPRRNGRITQIITYGDAVVVFQERAMNVLYGTPEFDGAGSLDASTSFPIGVDRNSNRGEKVVSTPFGLFFLDANTGNRLYVWKGSGYPEPVAEDEIFTLLANEGDFGLAYVNEKIVMMGDVILVYDIQTGTVVQHRATADTLSLANIQRGRSSSSDEAEDRLIAFDNQYVVNLGGAFLDPPTQGGMNGSETVDHDSTEIPGIIETGVFGPSNLLLRPERVYLTYALGGTTAYVEVQVTTGLNDEDTWTSPTTVFKGTGDVVKTERVEIDNMIRGIGLKLRLETKNTPPSCRILSLVVEGTVEGIGDSND